MIQQLTGVVHRQWVYRNTLVHFQQQGGVSPNQFDSLVRRVEELVIMDPDEMLEGDRKLLKVNQNALGGMCPMKQKTWIAEVEASRSAKRKERVRQGNLVHSGVENCTGTESSGDDVSQAEEETNLEPVNTQGSMKWKGVKKSNGGGKLANLDLFRRTWQGGKSNHSGGWCASMYLKDGWKVKVV